jgi:hypothetical protein
LQAARFPRIVHHWNRPLLISLLPGDCSARKRLQSEMERNEGHLKFLYFVEVRKKFEIVA